MCTALHYFCAYRILTVLFVLSKKRPSIIYKGIDTSLSSLERDSGDIRKASCFRYLTFGHLARSFCGICRGMSISDAERSHEFLQNLSRNDVSSTFCIRSLSIKKSIVGVPTLFSTGQFRSNCAPIYNEVMNQGRICSARCNHFQSWSLSSSLVREPLRFLPRRQRCL